MKLKKIGTNQTEVHLDGVVILFSYNTPVAYIKDGKGYRTNRWYSQTTTRHINKWLSPLDVVPKQVTQDEINTLTWVKSVCEVKQ